MKIQDQSGVTRSQADLTVGNGASYISGSHSVSHIQLNDQFSCGNDYALKVRKPYTITKQRERWTDEEHEKFLEALKLYGRAWRRIEEHVGTKTAVQIRSHAQKFFSKVVRDSGGNTTSLVEPIEIPPPRPKRKPMHPYPRKLVDIPNREIPNTQHSVRSNSVKSLDFDQENKSPKSVLSAVISETLGSSDSDTPTGSLSPASSISGVDTSSFAVAEQKTQLEVDLSPSPVGLNACSVRDEHPVVKLEHFHKESVSTKDNAVEESSGRTLKLFGATLLLRDTCRSPSSPTMEVCKSIPAAMNLTQQRDGNSDAAEAPATIVPWWTPFMAQHKDPEGKQLDDSDHGEFENKEVLKEEGSWTGSNAGSVSDGENNVEKPVDDQVKGYEHWYHLGHTTPSEKSTISKIRVRPKTCGKGFLPYKRCMSDRKNHCYSSITSEMREDQWIGLSL